MVTNYFEWEWSGFVHCEREIRWMHCNGFQFRWTYSNVWKQELLLIQSMDWKRIREADSQIKLFDGWASCIFEELGGVILNIQVTSVTNGPERKKSDEELSVLKIVEHTFNLFPIMFFIQKILLMNKWKSIMTDCWSRLEDQLFFNRSEQNVSLTLAAALARLSNARVIAAVLLVSVLMLQSICKLVLVLDDEDDDGGER